MSSVVEFVESGIAETLPSQFCLVFDGRSAGDTHYVAVFASVGAENEKRYKLPLLTISPMGNEEMLTAQAHHDFLSYILDMCGKDWSSVAAAIGDNCSTNIDTAALAKVPLVGCASHRFNLAVQNHLSGIEGIITKVQRLMVKLKTLLAAAKLRQYTHLKAKTQCPTRWGSAFEMLKRYLTLRPYLPKLRMVEVDQLTPTVVGHNAIENEVRKLEDLQSVSLELLREGTTIADVRSLFAGTVQAFPAMHHRLGPQSSIVSSPSFEDALVQLQRGNHGSLTSAQRGAVEGLTSEVEASSVQEEGEQRESFANRLLRSQRSERVPTAPYSDTRFVLPTSNACERLFSKAGYALSSRRRGILPTNFENQIFLHVNRDYWDLQDVSKFV